MFRLVLSHLLEQRTDIVVPCLVEAVLIELGEPLGVKIGLEVLESECVVENGAIVGGAGGETPALDQILKVAALQLFSGVDGSDRNSVDGGSSLKRKGSDKSKLHGWKLASVRSAEVKKTKPSRSVEHISRLFTSYRSVASPVSATLAGLQVVLKLKEVCMGLQREPVFHVMKDALTCQLSSVNVRRCCSASRLQLGRDNV